MQSYSRHAYINQTSRICHLSIFSQIKVVEFNHYPPPDFEYTKCVPYIFKIRGWIMIEFNNFNLTKYWQMTYPRCLIDVGMAWIWLHDGCTPNKDNINLCVFGLDLNLTVYRSSLMQLLKCVELYNFVDL
jgi:hypothetical protein